MTKLIPLHEIHDNPLQPRLALDLDVVAGVKAALEGASRWPATLPPVIVRPRSAGGYEIIAGHHRVTAARELSVAAALCQVEDLDDKAAAIALATTNNQATMSPLEHGLHAIRLRAQFGIAVIDYARQIGKSAQTIHNAVWACEVLEEFGGATSRFASVPLLALAALHAFTPEERRPVLFQLHDRKLGSDKALEVVRLVRNGAKLREAIDRVEGRIAPKQGPRLDPSGKNANANAASSGELAIAHLNNEVIAGYEYTLALYQARCEVLEKRCQLSDVDVEAIARRHRELMAELAKDRAKGRTPKAQQTGQQTACEGCFHGRASGLAASGWRCEAKREADCMPLTSAKCFVPRDDEEAS